MMFGSRSFFTLAVSFLAVCSHVDAVCENALSALTACTSPIGDVCGGCSPTPGAYGTDPEFCDERKADYCAATCPEGCATCIDLFKAWHFCEAAAAGCPAFTCPTPSPTKAPTKAPTDPAPAPTDPAPAPTCTCPQPAPAPSGSGCFSGESTVQVLGQGNVKMQDLQMGDLVLTGTPGNFKYQPMYAFGHLDKDVLADFYAIQTKGNKDPLEMTGEHLVYLAKKTNPVRADSVKVGDVLLSINGFTEITAIKMVKKRGLYNPLVGDGKLVVNGIAVSTYIALQEMSPEYYQVSFGGDYKINMGSHQSFVHLYLTPFRMLCMGVSSWIFQASDEHGIPYYISVGMKLVHWVGTQSVLVQLVFLLVTLPVLVALLAVEKLVGSNVAPLAIFAVVLLAKKAPAFIMRKQKVA